MRPRSKTITSSTIRSVDSLWAMISVVRPSISWATAASRRCSVTGSTSLKNVEAAGAIGAPAETYSQCAEDVLNGTVEAMSTDGSILLGLAAQNEGELEVVGPEFSEERIGVGYSKDYPEMCQWINDTLEQANEDGKWAEAFEANLGASGVETPDFPELDPCES